MPVPDSQVGCAKLERPSEVSVMKLSRRLIPLLVVTVLTSALVASAQLSSIGPATIEFLARGPAGMKINGTGSGLSVNETEGKLTITVPLTDLKTGIGLRDKHLRGYLHTDKHPNATLVLERSRLKSPADGQTAEAAASGNFTLNGVTKPLKFKYRAKRTGSDYHVQGVGEINIENHAVEQPCYLGVCVDPNVKFKASFKLRDK